MLALVFGGLLAVSVSTSGFSEIPFDPDRWEVHAQTSRIEEYLGRPSLFLQDGLATLRDLEFTDGIVEFDIAFGRERGFMGAVWRLQEEGNAEEFYLRPHQSGNPDACQYTPILNGVSSWQLYHGEGYGTPLEYLYDQWMPVRIVVSGDSAEVYVRDLETPALVIRKLKRSPGAGRVGLTARMAPAHFSRFRVLRGKPELKGQPPAPVPSPPGAIRDWEISAPFAEDPDLEDPAAAEVRAGKALEAAEIGAWQPLEAEPSGLVNLAHLHGVSEESNTVIARVTLVSEGDSRRMLRFGYSDRVRVFLNGRLLYLGDNTYRSRDYRYLGTIGYFDAVVLPLRKGENRLSMMVSESFGGWGVQAYLEDESGVSMGASR